jgi:endoglucanase
MSDIDIHKEDKLFHQRAVDNVAHDNAEQSVEPLSVRIGYGTRESRFKMGSAAAGDVYAQSCLPSLEIDNMHGSRFGTNAFSGLEQTQRLAGTEMKGFSVADGDLKNPETKADGGSNSQKDYTTLAATRLQQPYDPFQVNNPFDLQQQYNPFQVNNPFGVQQQYNPFQVNNPFGVQQQYNPFQVNNPFGVQQQYNPFQVNNPFGFQQQYDPFHVNNPYDLQQQYSPVSDRYSYRQQDSSFPVDDVRNEIIRQELRQADLLFKQIQATINLLNLELYAMRRYFDVLSDQLNRPGGPGFEPAVRPLPVIPPSPEPARPSLEPPRPSPEPGRPSPEPPRPCPEPPPPYPEPPRPSPEPPRPHPAPPNPEAGTGPQPGPGPEPYPEPYPQPEVPDHGHQRHHGVNLSGAEFGESALPGRAGVNYTFPTTQELDYYKQKGMDLIRMPFLWERIQPGLMKKNQPGADVDRSFDPEYSGKIDNFLTAADQRGMKVILDAHNYGRYNQQVIGASNITTDDFRQFWSQMAKRYGSHSSMYGYDLMNEPHDESNETWHAVAQSGVDGIRAAGDTHAVVVEGNQWSGAQSWAQLNKDLYVQDPANNVIYQAHTYWDSNHSGKYDGGAQQSYWKAVQEARNQGWLGQNEDPSNLGVKNVKPFFDWLKIRHARGLIGEYGVPSNDWNWVKMQDKFLAYAKANNVDTTAWGGGPWWGRDYVMSLEQGPTGDQSTSGPEPLNLKSVAADGNGIQV